MVRLPPGQVRVILLCVSGQADPVSGRRVVDASVYSVEFKPRGTGRRLVGFLTLGCLALTVYFGWQAYEERTPISYGITATLGALTIVRSITKGVFAGRSMSTRQRPLRGFPTVRIFV